VREAAVLVRSGSESARSRCLLLERLEGEGLVFCVSREEQARHISCRDDPALLASGMTVWWLSAR